MAPTRCFQCDPAAPRMQFKFDSRATGSEHRRTYADQNRGERVEPIRGLSRAICIPSGLAEIGVEEKNLEILAQNSIKDICCQFNTRKIKLEVCESHVRINIICYRSVNTVLILISKSQGLPI